MASPTRRRALLWVALLILSASNALVWLRAPFGWTRRGDAQGEHQNPPASSDWRWREYWRTPDHDWLARLERGELPVVAVSCVTGRPLTDAEAWVRPRAAFASDATVADLCAPPDESADARADSDGILWLRAPTDAASDEFMATLQALEDGVTFYAYSPIRFGFLADNPKTRAGLARRVVFQPSSRLSAVASMPAFAWLDEVEDPDPPFVRVVDMAGGLISRAHIYASASGLTAHEPPAWGRAVTDVHGYAPAPDAFDWRRDHELILKHPWFLRVTSPWNPAASRPTNITMSKGSRVRGKVLFPDDAWHGSVHVVVADWQSSDEHAPLLQDGSHDLLRTELCATNPHGYFDCGPLPAGEHDLELRVGGIPFGRAESVVLQPGSTAEPSEFSNLDLRRCTAMRLLPGDLPKGVSMEDVSLRVELEDGRLIPAMSRFLTLPSGTSRILAQAPGCKDAWLEPAQGPVRLHLARADD